MTNIFIIEHLEPELFEWCIIEYKHMSKILGSQNLWFTNIKEKDKKKLEDYGQVYTKSVKALGLDEKEIIVLDPEAKKTLKTEDKKFKFFLFGGILGDHPPRKRTKDELTCFFPKAEVRNLGDSQFSTDNAVFVVSQILKGKSLENLEFQEGVEIEINDIESTILPFEYPLVNGKPNISSELIEYLKKQK